MNKIIIYSVIGALLLGVVIIGIMFLLSADADNVFYCCNEKPAWKEEPCWAHEESWCRYLKGGYKGYDCKHKCISEGYETGHMEGFFEGELLERFRCVCEGIPSPAQGTMSVEQKCISVCASKLQQGINLSKGPCLSNKIQEDWVCDVAHEPREKIDDLPENQCEEYKKSAHHFVEVTPNCKLIKSL